MNHDRTPDLLGTLFVTVAGDLQENTFYGRRPQTILGVYDCLGFLFFSTTAYR